MRLSEAIRLGAMLKPQGFGMTHDEHGGTCALGAMFDALGVLDSFRYDWYWALRVFPVLTKTELGVCPACGESSVKSLIPHLNDHHRWTRERIAEWVETLEPADNPRASPPSADASDPHVGSTGKLATRV